MALPVVVFVTTWTELCVPSPFGRNQVDSYCLQSLLPRTDYGKRQVNCSIKTSLSWPLKGRLWTVPMGCSRRPCQQGPALTSTRPKNTSTSSVGGGSCIVCACVCVCVCLCVCNRSWDSSLHGQTGPVCIYPPLEKSQTTLSGWESSYNAYHILLQMNIITKGSAIYAAMVTLCEVIEIPVDQSPGDVQ